MAKYNIKHIKNKRIEGILGDLKENSVLFLRKYFGFDMVMKRKYLYPKCYSVCKGHKMKVYIDAI